MSNPRVVRVRTPHALTLLSGVPDQPEIQKYSH